MNKNINKPIWEDTVELKDFPSLDQDLKTDILVIGGGICGILTAYKLKNEGYNVVVVEANKIGDKITKRTTAFVSAFHDTLYQDLVKDLGFKKAKKYLKANLEAVKDFERLAKIYDFDYEKVSSCFYSKNDLELVNKEKETLEKMNYQAKFIKEIPLPINIVGGLEYPSQGQMNALKLLNCLSKELTIYENTKVIDIDKNLAKTEKNKIQASKIVTCTHFPIHNNLLYSMRMYQTRSYVLAIKYDKNLPSTYTDMEEGGLYFRKYKDFLIIGGNDIRTGNINDCYEKIKTFVKENFNDSKIEYYWANQDLVTLDNVAYIGKINSFSKDIYVATGFNLWGMTTSMISANIITDLIKGNKNKYEELYKPNRCMINKNLFINMAKFIKDEIGVNKKRCTHLKCVLNYNDCEKSYDCPCHGSRFSLDGEVLNDPADKNLK